MSFDLQRILESKRAFRQRLAARPIVEKLQMLDEMRARALSFRSATEKQRHMDRKQEKMR